MSSHTKPARAAGPAGQKEVRIDPEDGQPRTFEEMRLLCKDRYTDREIQDYWEKTMILHVGEGIHNVAADPFLTHASQNPAAASRTATPAAGGEGSARSAPAAGPAGAAAGSIGSMDSIDDGLVNVLKDPFLAGPKYTGAAPQPSKDPFATGPADPGADYGSVDGTVGPSRREAFAQAIAAVPKTATESLFSILGPGDSERDLRARNAIILGPWLLYLWVILMRLVLSHYTESVAVVLIVAAALSCNGAIFVWYQGVRSGPVSLVVAGTMGLLATVSGAWVGGVGYDLYWRQYWWTQTGFRGGVTTASTPAMARSDFAVLDFWDSEHGTTYNETRVDHSRSAGFKDSDYYCVAPIMSPDTAGAALARVNYWAVGINCCQRSGFFTCDGSRQWNAGRGVVMLGGGYPCPTCNADKFRLAVTKAEAMHGLVSANGAQFVRFVQDPSSIELGMLLRCLGFLVLAALLGGAGCAVLGGLAWYYGLGISGTHGGVPASAAVAGIDGSTNFDLLPITKPLKSGRSGGEIVSPAVAAAALAAAKQL